MWLIIQRLKLASVPLILIGCSTAPTPVKAPVAAETPTREQRIAELEREIAAKQHELGLLKQTSMPSVPRAAAEPSSKEIALKENRSEPATVEHDRVFVQELTKSWSQAALQLGDDALRASTLDRIRAALATKDPIGSLAALQTISRIGELSYDKAGMREFVLPYLDATDATRLRAAWYALRNTRTLPGDLDKLMQLEHSAPKEFLDWDYSGLLSSFANRDLSGPAGEIVERLLSQTDADSIRGVLSGLAHARVSPGIEQRLLTLSHDKDQELSHATIYSGLSMLDPKSAAVVVRLIELLGESDSENSGRALFGLGFGVQPSEAALVADAGMRLFETRESRNMQRTLQLIARNGTLAHAEKLEAIAARAGVSERQKAQATSTAELIRQRSK